MNRLSSRILVIANFASRLIRRDGFWEGFAHPFTTLDVIALDIIPLLFHSLGDANERKNSSWDSWEPPSHRRERLKMTWVGCCQAQCIVFILNTRNGYFIRILRVVFQCFINDLCHDLFTSVYIQPLSQKNKSVFIMQFACIAANQL